MRGEGPRLRLVRDEPAAVIRARVARRLAELRKWRAATSTAIARLSLADFLRTGWHVLTAEPLDWGWHLDLVCGEIQDVLMDWMQHRANDDHVQRCRNVLFSMPPGMAKSRIISVYAPAWMWLMCPGWQVLCTSATASTVLRDADLSRDLIRSDWYQQTFRPEWALRTDIDAKGRFANSAGGFRQSQPFAATVVGSRADAILVDDPNDLTRAAMSRDYLNDANRRWNTSWYDRLNDMGCGVRIGIQNRCSRDDWSGHVLASGEWAHVCLPAEYDPRRPCTTVYGRSDPRTREGEPLHPRRLTPTILASAKAALQGRFAMQWNQDVVNVEMGARYKRADWRFWRHPSDPDKGHRPVMCYDGPARPLPEMDQVAMVVDATFKSAELTDRRLPDRVAAFVVGRAGADRFVLDRRCDHMSFGETKQAIIDLAIQWPRAHVKWIELAANGYAIIDDLRGTVPGIEGVSAAGGKGPRAEVLASEVSAGSWYLPDGAPWLLDIIGEAADWPSGRYDDQIDALSHAAVQFQSATLLQLEEQRRREELAALCDI